MIFIANTLVLNGGSTFLLRACKELNHRGVMPIVLVLFGHKGSNVADELSRVAKIVTLKSLVWSFFSFLFIRQFGVFLPFDKRRIHSVFGRNIRSFHVMGIFGLIVAKRLSKVLGGVPITVGVYHQNEFFYLAPSSYFSHWVHRELFITPGENMIFFNEGNREFYAKNFNKNFLLSPVLPIGIEIPEINSDVWIKNRELFLIISIGNLVGFKTYNRHVISCLRQLRAEYPNVRYEIYGDGEELAALREHSISLGVNDLVKFCGHFDYAKFEQIVIRAHVFVGSGTAILESAALGVPSIVGIESIQEPLTYGFISDVIGLGYNEAGLDMPLAPMLKCIEAMFEAGDDVLQNKSIACRKKAREFSVEEMMDGFLKSEVSANLQCKLNSIEVFLLFISFFHLSLLDLLGIDRRFRLRRNQGWQK